MLELFRRLVSFARRIFARITGDSMSETTQPAPAPTPAPHPVGPTPDSGGGDGSGTHGHQN
jgi:hypothetical protein